jgi:hypothetical protein
MLKDSTKEKFRELASLYGLGADDFWKAPQGFVVITRSGVEKIHNGLLQKYTFSLTPCQEFTSVADGHFCVKADVFGEKGLVITTFGEASPKNNKNAYPVAMAEKRALSRAVLKVSDFYKLNVYGEDEI